MHYCSECGDRVTARTVDDARRARFVCDGCGAVHYRNPRVIVGCLAEWQGRILLCRRATEPRIGTWTLPAGFMEAAESMQEATLRELHEETGAEIGPVSLYSVFDVVHMNEIYIIYRGELRSPEIRAGREASEVRLFRAAELPWGELFYPAIESLLRRYLDDRSANDFGVHVGSSDGHGRVSTFEDRTSPYALELPLPGLGAGARR